MEIKRQVKIAGSKILDAIPNPFRSLTIFMCVLSVFAVTVLPLTNNSITSAAENNAIAGTSLAIQDAIDDLDGAPGTIYLKAGEFSLGGIVTLHEGVEIIGAGADFTTINTTGDNQWLFIPDGAGNCRISGIKFTYPSEGKGQAIYIGGDYSSNILDFRIDNCEFYGYGYYESAIKIRGDVRGVIDHNYFENTQDTWSDGYGYGVMYDGNNVYTADTSEYLGTAENVFIEDNEFRYCRHSIAANRGAHYVFRYNWCHDGILGQQVDAHGGYGDYNCGTILADVYNNVIEDYTSGTDRAMKFRGGQFIVHDNYSADYKHFIMLQLENGTIFDIALACKIHDSYEWNNAGLTDVYVEDGTWPSTKYIREGIEYFTDTPHPTYKPYTYPHPLTLEGKGTPNNPPVAIDDTATVVENSSATTINVLANDSDADGNTISVASVSAPSHGTAVKNGDGTVSYTPNADYSGPDYFTYVITDGNGGTDTATVHITVTGVNNPPVAVNQAVAIGENATVDITLSGSDIDGDYLTFYIVSGPSNGSLTPITQNGQTTYTPGEGFTGKDTFTFKVYDGKEYSNIATVTITGSVPPGKPEISLSNIAYATEGGKFNDMHLQVTVAIADDKRNPVGNASVSVDIYLDGNLYSTETGTTGADGSVTFKATKAPPGIYTTRVTKIAADGLAWDGITPSTNFLK